MKKFLHIGMSCKPNGHGLGMEKGCAELGWQYRDIQLAGNYNAEIQKVAEEYKPDLVFIQIQDFGISVESLFALKKNGAWILNWTGDVRNRIPQYIFFYAKYVHMTCFSNMPDVITMQTLKYRCEFLQIGYDPEIYNPFGKSVNIADIVYMANMSSQFPLSGYRNDIVKELKKTYGDRFKCFGTGREDGNYMGNQEGEANVYRGAKIGINLSHYNYERYTSDRMFRMLGCGLLVLSHNYNGIDKDFTSGRHLIVWNDIHELKSQINFFLEHSVSATVIGTDGYDLAIQNFTFAHMAKNIISLYHDNV